MKCILESKHMSNTLQLSQLLDQASKVAGNDSRLAAMLEVPRQHVNHWRNGLRSCSPEDVAQIADIAGMDGVKWLIRATLAKHEGTAKGDRLMKVLGKALAATDAVASNGANAHPTFFTNVFDWFIQCIFLLNEKRHSPRKF